MEQVQERINDLEQQQKEIETRLRAVRCNLIRMAINEGRLAEVQKILRRIERGE